MNSLVHIILSSIDVVAILFLLIFIGFLVLFTQRARAGGHMNLRRIPLYEHLGHLAAQAVETGKPIHLGMGTGQLGGQGAAESLIALTVLTIVAERAADAAWPVFGTTADGVTLASALGILRNRMRPAGHSTLAQEDRIRFVGPDPFAYAAGVRQSVQDVKPLANVLLGQWGAEALWVAEASRTPDLPQIGGSTPPATSALLAVSLDETVIGEDLFAAGAYLGRTAHLGSLAAQDLVRIIVILSIIAGVLLKSLGYWL